MSYGYDAGMIIGMQKRKREEAEYQNELKNEELEKLKKQVNKLKKENKELKLKLKKYEEK